MPKSDNANKKKNTKRKLSAADRAIRSGRAQEARGRAIPDALQRAIAGAARTADAIPASQRNGTDLAALRREYQRIAPLVDERSRKLRDLFPESPASRRARQDQYRKAGSILDRMMGRMGSSGGAGFAQIDGHLAANAQRARTGLDSLMSKIMGSTPQAPGAVTVTPSLVDVEATLKPYRDARTALEAQGAQRREALKASAAGDARDVRATNAATQKRLAEMETLRALEESRALEAQAANAAAAQRDAAAQGVDTAGIQAYGQHLGQQAAASDDAYASRIADDRAVADLEAARRQESLAGQSRAASNQLDANLMAAMLGIQSQELGARTEAEQFNARAIQEAAAANAAAQGDVYQNQMDLWNMRAQLAPALMEQGQAMGAFSTPGRGSVVQELMAGKANGVERMILTALQSADNPDDAWDAIMDGAEVINNGRDERGAKRYTPNTARIMDMIRRYYTQDTSSWDPAVARQVLALYGVS